MKRKVLWCGLSLLLVAALMLTAITSSCTTQPEYEPSVQVDAYTLLWDYLDNPVAADQKYKDKLLEVTGTVEAITRDPKTNEAVIAMLYDANCGASQEYSTKLEEYKKELAEYEKTGVITPILIIPPLLLPPPTGMYILIAYAEDVEYTIAQVKSGQCVVLTARCQGIENWNVILTVGPR